MLPYYVGKVVQCCPANGVLISAFPSFLFIRRRERMSRNVMVKLKFNLGEKIKGLLRGFKCILVSCTEVDLGRLGVFQR